MNSYNYINILNFGVLTTVVIKSVVSWDTAPCSQLEINRRYGEALPLSSGSKNKPIKNSLKQVTICYIFLGKFP